MDATETAQEAVPIAQPLVQSLSHPLRTKSCTSMERLLVPLTFFCAYIYICIYFAWNRIERFDDGIGNNRSQSRPIMMSAIDVIGKTFVARLYLVLGLRKIAP